MYLQRQTLSIYILIVIEMHSGLKLELNVFREANTFYLYAYSHWNAQWTKTGAKCIFAEANTFHLNTYGHWSPQWFKTGTKCIYKGRLFSLYTYSHWNAQWSSKEQN